MGKRKSRRGKAGRPPGATNRERPVAAEYPAACPSCHSTDREPFRGSVREVEQGGTAPTGRDYTHIAWKDTRCRACGQFYRVRVYENRATA